MNEGLREQVEAERVSEESSALVEAIEALSGSPSGLAHKRRAKALIELLEQVRPGPGAAGDAATLTKYLEAGAFNDAVDAGGRSCRAAATDALLRLGYPWALSVRPEDLSWFRAHSRRSFPRRWVVLGALLGATLLGVATGMTERKASVQVRDSPVVKPAQPVKRPIDRVLEVPVWDPTTWTGTEVRWHLYPAGRYMGELHLVVDPHGGKGFVNLSSVELYDAQTGEQFERIETPAFSRQGVRMAIEPINLVQPHAAWIAVVTLRDEEGKTIRTRTVKEVMHQDHLTTPAGDLKAEEVRVAFGPGGPKVIGVLTGQGPTPSSVSLVADTNPVEAVGLHLQITQDPADATRMTFEAPLDGFDSRAAYRAGVAFANGQKIWFRPDTTRVDRLPTLGKPLKATVGGVTFSADVKEVTTEAIELEVRLSGRNAARREVDPQARVQLFGERGLLSARTATATRVDANHLRIVYDFDSDAEVAVGTTRNFGLEVQLMVDGKPVTVRTESIGINSPDMPGLPR